MHSILAQSSWTPRTYGPAAWFKASRGVTIVSEKVAAWADLSGNSNHLEQSNAALRPTVSASVAARNNKPAINGAAGGVCLYSTNPVTLPRESTWVIALGSLAASAYLLSHWSGSAEYAYVYGPGSAAFYLRSGVSQYYKSTAGFALANTSLVCAYDGATLTTLRNNASISGTVVGSPLPAADVTATLSVFSGQNGTATSACEALEVIVYPRALSATELAQINRYLVAEYGA